ncbi:MAG: hypothetical protein II994_07135 [Lachnospiraceae bacterium]|nr:hypothetical protein [Lachnospiraceae bacterium]
MQSINYWKQFENTGKIEDYLSYKSQVSQPGKESVVSKEEGEASANPYAGIRMCDRNHIEADARWGI